MSEGYIPRLAPYFLLILIQAGLFFTILPLWQTTDETTWIGNGIKFEQALLQHNWSNTRLTTRPGVTVEWLIAATSRFVFGENILRNTPPDNLATQQNIISASRVTMVSCLIILNLLLFYFLKRLLAAPVAFFISLLLGIHPIFTEATFLVWTDMLLVYFLVLPVITFLLYTQTYFKKYIFLTGLFFGLAILTKVIAWIIIPILLAIVVMHRQHMHRLLNALGMATLMGLAFFYILYPASWLHPGILFDRVHEVDASYTSSQAVRSDQPLWQYILFIFLIDPLLIITALVVLYMLTRQWLDYKAHKLSLIFFMAAGIYLIAVTGISLLKDNGLFSIRSDRYAAPLIPFLLIGSFSFLNTRKPQWIVTALSLALAVSYMIYF